MTVATTQQMLTKNNKLSLEKWTNEQNYLTESIYFTLADLYKNQWKFRLFDVQKKKSKTIRKY